MVEVVIKIPEKMYEDAKNGKDTGESWYITQVIKQGTPLPKGHGRLIDADKLDTRERGNNSQRTMWWNIECIVEDAPTIIEADKESDNG